MKDSKEGKPSQEEKLLQAMEQLKAGDESGFAEIYDQTYAYVYQRAKYMTNDEQEALDLLQEVYLALFKDAEKIKNHESLYGWLKTVTFRQGLKLIEKKRQSGSLVENEIVVFGSITDDEETIEDNYANQQDLDFVKHCIAQLPEEQRMSVLAYYYDDMKIEEIAELFETSTGTVKSRLYHARKKLKLMLAEQEEKQGYRFYAFGAPLLTASLTRAMEIEASTDTAQRSFAYEGIQELLQHDVTRELASTAGDALAKTIGASILAKLATLGAKRIAISTVSVGVAAAVATTGYVAVNNEPVPLDESEPQMTWEEPVYDPAPEPVQETVQTPEPEPEPEPEPVENTESNVVENRGTLHTGESTEEELVLSEERDVDITLLGQWPGIGIGLIGSYAKYRIIIYDDTGNAVSETSGETQGKDVSFNERLAAGTYTIVLQNPGTAQNYDSSLDYYMIIEY